MLNFFLKNAIFQIGLIAISKKNATDQNYLKFEIYKQNAVYSEK